MSAQGATVARNYAETLLALASKAGDAAGWGREVRAVADAIGLDVALRRFLESPRIPAAAKSRVFETALADRVPRAFLRWLQAMIRNRRISLLPSVADEYEALLDTAENRVHARLTFAKAPTDADKATIAARLSDVLKKTVVPHVVVDPSVIGGVVVRVGDTIMDGSVRRRLAVMRKKMAGTGSV